MTRPDLERPTATRDAAVARVRIAGGDRLEDLATAVTDVVSRLLPDAAEAMRLGATSLAPRDEAARAVRWISRLGAGRGMQTEAVAPTSEVVRSWRRAASRGKRSAQPVETVCVGVSRLNLEPETGAVVQPFALGVWAALLPPPQRLVARFEPEPVAAQVEAAMDAAPAATVLVGEDAGLAWAVVGADLLAVEVVGRALRAIAQPIGDLGISPWQAPSVQRGIERGAGATHPDSVEIEAVWAGADERSSRERFERVVGSVAARAGISTLLFPQREP